MTLVFETRTRQDLKYTQVRYTSDKKKQEHLRCHITALDIHDGKFDLKSRSFQISISRIPEEIPVTVIHENHTHT